MVFASASGSSGKPKPKPQQWSSELPTYITVYVSKPVSQTVEPPIPNDIVAFVPPAPPVSTSPPRPSNAARPGNRPPQPPPSDPRDDVDHQARPGERRGSSDTTQNQAPTKPDYAPDEEEESETVAVDREKAWSYEDIFLSMDAVDLSYYSSLREYDLVREAAISLRHEKLILFYLDKPREYLKHFATYTWDEEADSATEEFIQWYVERFRPKLERQLDILTSGPAFGEAEEAIEDLTAGEEEDTLKDLTSGEAEDTIKRWHKDLTNDEREVVIAIDLRTGETLFVRYGDEDSVTLHDEQKELVEDRYVALLHHHPNNSAASLADLDATVWMKAEFLLVANQDGTLHRYARVGEAMIPLEPTHNPEYAAPVDPMETALADAAYLIQTLSEIGNPPEMVMLEEPNEDEITINMDSRLVDEFLLNPATIVFLDDVANEYGVEDPSFFSAMVPTIIYRELQDPRGLGLPVAAFPRHQHYWDTAKRLGQSPFFVIEQLVRAVDRDFNLEGRFDGDPSLGIGALSREAGKNIQSDAEEQGMTLYFPALGFDRPTTLDHMPFSPGEHFVTQSFFVGSLDPDMRVLRAIPPSNEKEGVWRVEIPQFEYGPPASLREQYEPTIGILAAEVAIAMQTPQYKLLGSDEERIAYIIGFHANRSRVPGDEIYDLSDIAEDSRKQTRTEIRWAREFEGIMDDRRAQNQADS